MSKNAVVNNRNEIAVTSDHVLTGISASGSVTLFESDAIKESLCGGKNTDASGKSSWKDSEQFEAEMRKHTLNYRIDFTGVTIVEMLNLHVKTTTVFKMLYNNELKHWSESVITQACSESRKNARVFMAREILDGRKRAGDGSASITKSLSKLGEKIDAGSISDAEKQMLADLIAKLS